MALVLKISPEKLAVIAKQYSQSKTNKKPSSKAKVASPTSAVNSDTLGAETGTQGDNSSESNSTPAPPNGVASSDSKKRKSMGNGESPTDSKNPAPGTPAADDNGTPKPKGKPGPKKRKADGEIAPVKAAATGPAPAAHKLGPKANQGAINAGLRALDRSGKKCRRWHRRSFMLKSFTGVSWAISCWETPKLPENGQGENGDLKAESTSASDANKQEPASSAVGSERSLNGGDTIMKDAGKSSSATAAPAAAAARASATTPSASAQVSTPA